MEYNESDTINRARRIAQDHLDTAPLYGAPPDWTNPGPDNTVLAEAFLCHVDLDRPGINAVLREAYPYLDHNPGLKQTVHARVRFIAWATLKGHNKWYPAWRRLAHDLDAQALLGFRDGVPCYDTIREFVHERLAGDRFDRLVQALVAEQARLCPDVGLVQVEDATPIEAMRHDESVPYNEHYQCRMMKLEARWDPEREALLAHEFYDGTAHESAYLLPLSERASAAGCAKGLLVVDRAYSGFDLVARSFGDGFRLVFKTQDEWRVDAAAAKLDVEKRYQEHWRHAGFRVDASFEFRLRFLVDHGSVQDVEAVGRFLRDEMLEDRSLDGVREAFRAQNEGLNAELKRLPMRPMRRGVSWLRRRAEACVLTLHLVQLTRLQHGVRRGLCRTASIL